MCFNIPQILNHLSNAKDTSEKIQITNELIQNILSCDWSSSADITDESLFDKEDLISEDQGCTLRCLARKLVNVVVDPDLEQVFLRFAASILFMVESFGELKERFCVYILQNFIKKLRDVEGYELNHIYHKELNDLKTITSLSISFLFITQGIVDYFGKTNSAVLNDIINTISLVIDLVGFNKRIYRQCVHLIHSIFKLYYMLANYESCHSLARITGDAKFYFEKEEYGKIATEYFVNFSRYVSSSNRSVIGIKALLSTAIEFLFEFNDIAVNAINWINTICDAIKFIRPDRIHEEFNVLLIVPETSIIMAFYKIFETIFLNLIENNLESLSEDYKQDCESLYYNQEGLRDACKIWKSVLDAVYQTADSELHSMKDVLRFYHRVIKTELRLNLVLKEKYVNLNLKFPLVTPLQIMNTFIARVCVSSEFNSHYSKLLKFYVNFLLVHDNDKPEDLFAKQILLYPWNANVSLFDERKAVFKCLDGVVNLILAQPPDAQLNYLSRLVECIIACTDDDTRELKIKRLSVLSIIFTWSISNGRVDLLKEYWHYIFNQYDLKNLYYDENLKLICFTSGRCYIKKCKGSWALNCKDCDEPFNLGYDKIENRLETLNLLKRHTNLLCKLYNIQFFEDPTTVLCSIKRFLKHSEELRNDNRFLKIYANWLITHDEIHTLLLPVLKLVLFKNDSSFNYTLADYILNNVIMGITNGNWFNEDCDIKKYHWIKHILAVFIQLNKCPKGEYLTPYFKTFVIFCVHIKVDEDLLRETLNLFAITNNIVVHQLLLDNIMELSKLCIDIMVSNINPKLSIECKLICMAKLFGYTPKEFLKITCTPFMVSYALLLLEESEAKYTIAVIASALGIPLRELITFYFPDIFGYIFFAKDRNIFGALNTLMYLAKAEIKTLMHLKHQKLLNKVLMHIEEPIKVIRFITCMFPRSSFSESLKILSDNVTGILTYISGKLMTNETPRDVVISCLKGLAFLVRLPGEHVIEDIWMKMITTFRTSLARHYQNHPSLCLDAWVSFIYQVDVIHLGPFLPVIFIELMNLFNDHIEDVSEIFYYLVVENGQLVKDYLPALYFVPDHSYRKMHQVWLVIQEAYKKFRSEQLLNKLTRIIGYIDTVSIESRISGLTLLLIELDIDSTSLYNKGLANEQLETIFQIIIDCLMENINDDNEDVKILCGRCLGQLGAVNPSRLTKILEKRPINAYIIESEEFVFWCIKQLLKELNNAKSSDFANIITTCIQELLKLYFKGDLPRIRSFISKFSVHDRHILEPLITSRYIVNKSSNDISKQTWNSFFRFVLLQSSLSWICSWSKRILSYLINEMSKNVFTICLIAMEVSVKFAEVMFPFFVLELLKDDPKICMNLLTEGFKQVLNYEVEVHRYKIPSSIYVKKKTDKCFCKFDFLDREKCLHLVHDVIDFLYVASVDLDPFQEFGIQDKMSIDFQALNTNIKAFLSCFPLLALSWKAYTLQFYYRSLFYFEQVSIENDGKEQNLMPFKNLYSKLDDMDSLFGVTRYMEDVNSTDEIDNDLVSGRLQDIVGVYQRKAEKYDSSFFRRGLVQCYLKLNEPYIALQFCNAFLEDTESADECFYVEYTESLWAGGELEKAGDILQKIKEETKWTWSIDNLLVLNYIRMNKLDIARNEMDNIFSNLVNDLAHINSSNAMGIYRQGYDTIVKLHISREVEKFLEVIGRLKTDAMPYLSDVSKDFDKRIELVRYFGGYREKILGIREKLFALGSHIAKLKDLPATKYYFDQNRGFTLLEMARHSRKNNDLHTCYTNLTLAGNYKIIEVFIEKAKYFRAKNDMETAVNVLTRGIKDLERNNSQGLNNSSCCDTVTKAKALLLIARYNDENMNVDSNDGRKCYEKAVAMHKLEKTHIYLAKYLYRLHQEDSSPDNTAEKRRRQLDAAVNFSESLSLGGKYVYQAMSSLLGLWLDYSARYFEYYGNKAPKKSSDLGPGEAFQEFNKLMRQNVSKFPPYLFMTTFSLILSRMTLKCEKTTKILDKIVTNIIKAYPQQALWMVLPYYYSSDANQRDRMLQVMHTTSTSTRDIGLFIKSFLNLIQGLTQLCRTEVSKKKNIFKVSSLKFSITNLFSWNGVSVLIPVQRFMTLDLPNHKLYERRVKNEVHAPFSTQCVYFQDIFDEVPILNSAQRPKKVDFIGTDGKVYPFLLKSADDLRVDARIMEFNSVVNMYLNRSNAAHDRSLHIKTYSVVPLSFEQGMLEWLPNLTTLNNAIRTIHNKLDKPVMTPLEVRKLMLPPEGTLKAKRNLLENVLYPRHPVVLRKWFLHQFSSPVAWYLAKDSFIKSLAVMSIVGNIVGLGDRHCENVLIDLNTGHVVHVDFNCVFHKGDRFSYPEIVPFRLTRNLTDICKPTGIQGLFTKCCEIVCSITRTNSEQLISVLKPFLYYDIARQSSSSFSVNPQETHLAVFTGKNINEEALYNISIVEKKLLGMVRNKDKQFTKQLSVEGQVKCLITQATDIDNLSRMYYGWAAFK